MTDDDHGYRRRPPTYAESLANCIVLQPTAALTEQEIAAQLVAGRERLRKLDDLFRDDFISPIDEQIVSRALAKRMGYSVGFERED